MQSSHPFTPEKTSSSLAEGKGRRGHRCATSDGPSARRDHGTGHRNTATGLTRKPTRQSTLRSQPNTPYLPPSSAISPHTDHNNYTRQDVPHFFVNQSVTAHPQPQQYVASLETTVSSPFSHNVPLNTFSPRLSTSTVSPDLQALAAQHELPTRFPKIPQLPQSRSIRPAPVPVQQKQQPHHNNLVANYLNMLSQSEASTVDEAFDSPDNVWESPFEHSSGDMFDFSPSLDPYSPNMSYTPELTPANAFLTSPYGSDTSPLFEEFLSTPDLGSGEDQFGIAMGESPLISNDMTFFDEFAADALFPASVQKPAFVAPLPSSTPSGSTISPPLAQLEGLLSMSPATPQLGAFASPNMPSSTSMLPPTGRRKSSATGTRKNINPDKLLSVDAPTQARKYVTPSSTSRKELPAVFAKKRGRSAAFGGDDDEVDYVRALPPDASEEDQIAAKRRQNTVAARRSRKRKLETQQAQEQEIAELAAQVALWKGRSEQCIAVMQSHGIPAPVFN